MLSEPEKRIDNRAIKVWKIHGMIETVVLGLIVTGIGLFVVLKFAWSWWFLVIPGFLVVFYGLLEIVVLPGLRWQRWRYEINDQQIDLQEGVWFISRTLIPMVRVQYVQTHQGIVMRRYGLANVVVYTAADSHEIPALSLEVADSLRDQIARLARVSDDVI